MMSALGKQSGNVANGTNSALLTRSGRWAQGDRVHHFDYQWIHKPLTR
jgi:hypothetical protein